MRIFFPLPQSVLSSRTGEELWSLGGAGGQAPASEWLPPVSFAKDQRCSFALCCALVVITVITAILMPWKRTPRREGGRSLKE